MSNYIFIDNKQAMFDGLGCREVIARLIGNAFQDWGDGVARMINGVVEKGWSWWEVR